MPGEVQRRSGWSCHSRSDQCNKQPATPAEKDTARATAALIKAEKDPFCAQIQQMAYQLIETMEVWHSKIMVYDENKWKTLAADLDHDQNNNPVLHIWNKELTRADTIAHEPMHAITWPGDSRTMRHNIIYGGRTVDEWAEFCTI